MPINHELNVRDSLHIIDLLFSFLLLGMDSSIPRYTSFNNLLEDSYDEYMLGSSHISGEDSVPQAQAFS